MYNDSTIFNSKMACSLDQNKKVLGENGYPCPETGHGFQETLSTDRLANKLRAYHDQLNEKIKSFQKCTSNGGIM